jgi:hypothetical protein
MSECRIPGRQILAVVVVRHVFEVEPVGRAPAPRVGAGEGAETLRESDAPARCPRVAPKECLPEAHPSLDERDGISVQSEQCLGTEHEISTTPQLCIQP